MNFSRQTEICISRGATVNSSAKISGVNSLQSPKTGAVDKNVVFYFFYIESYTSGINLNTKKKKTYVIDEFVHIFI